MDFEKKFISFLHICTWISVCFRHRFAKMPLPGVPAALAELPTLLSRPETEQFFKCNQFF